MKKRNPNKYYYDTLEELKKTQVELEKKCSDTLYTVGFDGRYFYLDMTICDDLTLANLICGGYEKTKRSRKQRGEKKYKGFRTITANELKAAYDYQKKDAWDFYDERDLLETILHNRLNFLLLAYSLFLTAYFMVRDHNDKLTLLIIGFIIIFLLATEIFRAYIRFRLLLKMIYCLDDKDVVPIIRNEFKTLKIHKFFPHSSIIGFILPGVMLVSFIIGIIFNFLFN